jgi:hypothetical protein
VLDIVEGTAIFYGLDVTGFESRPKQMIFFSPCPSRQALEPPSNLLCYGQQSPFLGVMRPGCCVDHSPLSSAEVRYKYNYTFTHPSCLHATLWGGLYKSWRFVTTFLRTRPPVTHHDPNKSSLPHTPTQGLKYTGREADTPQSVGLLWTRDQPHAEPSTWQHTTLTKDRPQYPRRDSNPQSQQASGRRSTP